MNTAPSARSGVLQRLRFVLGAPCALCGTATRGQTSGFCTPCWDELPWLDHAACPRCAAPAPAGALCGACLKHPPHFDATRAALRYAFPLAQMLHAYKYRGQLALARVFERAMLRMPLAHADVLVALPVTPARLRERGFNQSAQFAKVLGRRLGVPADISALRKVRETRAQSELPWDERRANVRGAFACNSSLAGKHVGLVDDVMTTGASANEAARVLKQAGAAQVSVWVLARTPPAV